MAEQKVSYHTVLFAAASAAAVNQSNDTTDTPPPLINPIAAKAAESPFSDKSNRDQSLSGTALIPDDLATDNSLSESAPLTSELLALLNGGVEANKENILLIVKKLQEMESAENLRRTQASIAQKMLEAFEKSDYWQKAQDIVNSVMVGSSYTVDVTFYPNNTLKSKKIDIRLSGKQNRHITPIAVIERIILNSLQEKAPLDAIFTSLYSKLEVFKLNLNDEDNKLIQGIFDFFKHADYRTVNGISLLIKIIAHFYNKKLLLTMSDDVINPPNTYASYIVPSLEFGGEKYAHNAEGSLVTALLKILDGMERMREEKKSLSELQIKQMVYAIFALFDYLPLPKDARKNKDLASNTEKDRYVGEPIERLYAVAANHLHFIFEGYPRLADAYKKEILEGFLEYIAFGVSSERLCKVLNCKNKSGVSGKTGIRPNPLKNNYTSEGSVYGFSAQYGQSKKSSFLDALTARVKEILSDFSSDFLLELESTQDAQYVPDEMEFDFEQNTKKLDAPFEATLNGLDDLNFDSLDDNDSDGSFWNSLDSSVDASPSKLFPASPIKLRSSNKRKLEENEEGKDEHTNKKMRFTPESRVGFQITPKSSSKTS